MRQLIFMNLTRNLGIDKDVAGIKPTLWQTYNRDDIGVWFYICWCLIFAVIGALLRFYKLGSLPLSDVELENALLAWLIVGGQNLVDTNWLANSALVNFTQIIIFWVTDTANLVSVRLVTALCGSALIFAPLLFVRHLGRVGAGVTMALLSVSPSLVMVSRTADGMSISLVCLVVALVGLESAINRKSGHGFGMILLGLVLGVLCGLSFVIPSIFIIYILFRNPYLMNVLLEKVRAYSFRNVIAYVVIGLLVVTAFFRYRYGLMVLTEPLFQWFLGWSSYNRIHSELMIMEIVLVNQPLLILLCIVGVVIALHGRSLEQNLLVLLACGLLYGVVYSGVQSRDVVWVIIPLYVVCGRVLVWALQGQWSVQELIVATIQVVILGSLIVFGYIVFGGQDFTFRTADYSVYRIIIIQVVVLVGLLVLVVALFSAGWSAKVSMASVMIVLFLFASVWSMHRSWTMVHATSGGYTTNWHSTKYTGSDKIMLKTLENLSLRYVGHPREVDIKVIGPHNRQLAWFLRDFTNVKWGKSSVFVDYPSVILTFDVNEPIVTDSGYIGQEFQLYDDYYGGNNLGAKNNRNFKFQLLGSTFDTIVIWTRQGDTIPE